MVLIKNNANQQMTMKMSEEMGVSSNQINSIINPFVASNTQNSFMINRLSS
jgi:hypothetical protein